MVSKLCTSCLFDKPIKDFYKSNAHICGYRSHCKKCISEYGKTTGERRKVLRKKNFARISEVNKAGYIRHRKKRLSQKAEYYRANLLTIKANNLLYYRKNRDLIIRKKRKYSRERRRSDINFRLKCNLRSRLIMAIKGDQKTGSAVQDLGCTILELRKYLELRFKPGMAWDNYGFYGWHIDHIVPLCSFNLQDPEQFKKASHYTNLQPLWAHENIQKSGKTG